MSKLPKNQKIYLAMVLNPEINIDSGNTDIKCAPLKFNEDGLVGIVFAYESRSSAEKDYPGVQILEANVS